MRSVNIMVGIVTLLAVSAGCEEMTYNPQTRQMEPRNNQPNSGASHLSRQTVAADTGGDFDRSIDVPDNPRGATDIALKWANKYATLSNELVYANKRIHELENEKKGYQTEIARLKAELARAKRELSDANVMLAEMKKELSDWRSNVLGYRKEMMASLAALMTSQQKVLELLGAEVPQGNLTQANR